VRAVARELGTSHQLLSHYLNTWDKWEGKEYKRHALQIRARAWAENRDLTPLEDAQATAYGRAAIQAILTSAYLRAADSGLNEVLKRARAGVALSKHEIRFVNLLARKGFPMAHKIIQVCSQSNAKKQLDNLPSTLACAAKSFRSESR
jgi:hypothetical protein